MLRGVGNAPLRTLAATSGLMAPLYNAGRFATSTTTDSDLRIYKSPLPSVGKAFESEQSLYMYMMKRWTTADPQKIACLQAETGQKFTYPELLVATERVAQLLYHAGEVRCGDVVCIALLNTVLYGPIAYGTMRLGGVVSTVNAVAAPTTLAYHFKTNKCKIVLGMKYFQKALEAAAELTEHETGVRIKVLYPEDFMKLQDKLDIPTHYNPIKDAKADDTVFIPFSSGTTGLPKGVQLTNRNLIANMEQTRAVFGCTKDDVSVSVLPFFHIFGFTCCLNLLMTAQATQIVMMKYTVDSFLDVIEKYKVSLCPVAPPILISLLKSQDKMKGRDLSSLSAIRSGSAPLSPEVEKACEQLFHGCSVGQGYGMTEMSPVVSALTRDAGVNRVYGSGGAILPDTEVRIVKINESQQSGADRSSGVDTTDAEDGEVWVRGPQMMKGYLKAEDTVATMQDGWYRTGDIGHVDAKTGDLLITDRLKELIKYKGFQVSPASMEAVLLNHPWIQDCIVVGVPDPRDVSFENPRALVVLKPGLDPKDAVRASDEIYRYVMSRNPPHKRLHGGVRIVDAIPRNDAGKVMRRQVRQDEVKLMKTASEAP